MARFQQAKCLSASWSTVSSCEFQQSPVTGYGLESCSCFSSVLCWFSLKARVQRKHGKVMKAAVFMGNSVAKPLKVH